jgi:PKD repeat protein
VRGIRYGLGFTTTYNLEAAVTDAEQSEVQMLYQWQTILHHNNHEHTEPINTNHATTTVISPVGCDGNLYYYRILLTVTDPAGLSGTNEVDIYPACSNAAPIATFAASTTNGNPPLTVSFDAAASNDPDGDPLGYTWDFGDGTTAGGLRPTHSYTGPGDFTARLTVTDTFGLNSSVTKKIHANGTPTISSIAAQTVAEDTSTGPINFTVGDLETAATNLTVTARSSNSSLVPNANMTLAGSASNRTVTIQPAANLSGNATITLVVTDGSGLSSTNSFLLTVTPANDPPVISAIANQTIVRNNSTALIPFVIGDIESSAGNLMVTGVSSNQTLIPNSGIAISGSGSNRFVTLQPATNQIGSATVALIVSDGSATSQSRFTLNVVAPPARIGIKVNFQPATAPTISGYLVDAGMIYGDRGNGQIYGWDTANTSGLVDRDSALSPDQRFDTLNLMQAGGASRTWEIALSNGFYTVLVVAGDPNATTGIYRINAEGASLVNGSPSSTNRWIYGAKTINVTDGRLTLTNASGALSNKICWIDIVDGPAASGAIGPANLTLLGRDTNGWPSLQIQGQAGRNYVIEASSNLQQWYPAGLFQNTGGTLVYIDKNTVSNTVRFYRVFLVP